MKGKWIKRRADTNGRLSGRPLTRQRADLIEQARKFAGT
jgi:hypothetical protein